MHLFVFKHNLRLFDNQALCLAAKERKPLVCLFIDKEERPAASTYWLHKSLAALRSSHAEKGIQLLYRKGDVDLSVFGAEKVFYDDELNYLTKPGDVLSKEGNFYKVFTPFYNAFLQVVRPSLPLAIPKMVAPEKRFIEGDIPEVPFWAKKMDAYWEIGEAGALKKAASLPTSYEAYRNIPAIDGVSKISPYLVFGEISPRTIWYKAKDPSFLRQIVWREFFYHLYVLYPDLRKKEMRPEFGNFQWDYNPKLLEAWKKGLTGFPLVDAGMRQLWETGWMHNRVRMVVASFLVKDLLLDWREGEEWFWHTLVDADAAQNGGNWQWVAGCGTDAAPYFRIFNPESQRLKFDPEETYVKRWLPEFGTSSYPKPIVDHDAQRKEALLRFSKLK